MDLKRTFFTGWRRWATLGVALVVLYLLGNVVIGKDLRVWWILRDLDRNPKETVEALEDLNLPYRGALRRALLRGGRKFSAQIILTEVLLRDPFFDRKTVEDAVRSGDPVVRRAAVAALMRDEGTTMMRSQGTPGPLPDAWLEVYRDWASEVADPWLSSGLGEAVFFDDPRLVEILVPLVRAVSTEHGETALEIGRANANREAAARALQRYVGEPGVVDALVAVAKSDEPVDNVKGQIAQSLLRAGYTEDLEVYRVLARSESDLVRQILAANLERIRDRKIVPLALFLAEDENEVVRRNAVNALILNNAPELMERLRYLAEDWYSAIKGDLATAVDIMKRLEHVPFVAWCLEDHDPLVVEKAVVSLFKLTGRHHGFPPEVWENYRWDRYLDGGAPGEARQKLILEFMEDEERRADAVTAFTEEFPPRYTDPRRVPHLIRQLGHRDSRNVRRAVRELARVTGRTDGFPPEMLDPSPDENAEVNATHLFVTERRRAVVEDWVGWYEGEAASGDDRQREDARALREWWEGRKDEGAAPGK